MDIPRKRRDPVHGNMYQVKLLMLFLYGGIENKYNFRLEPEVEEAEKFDDLVFEYTVENKIFFRFLQAKHRLDSTKKITAEELLNESEGDFSLIKYLFSYQKQKQKKRFKEGCIQDVILCTNIGFDSTANLESKGIYIEKIVGEDKIFDIVEQGITHSKLGERYKFSQNTFSVLKSKSEKYHLTKLAKELADSILYNKIIQSHQENGIFNIFHLALAKDVINTKDKKFHDNFIRNENIPPKAKIFRDILETELKKKTKHKLTLKNLNKALSDKSILGHEISLKLDKKFGVKKYIGKEWPVIKISRDDVKDFISHIAVAVKQPTIEELITRFECKIAEEQDEIDFYIDYTEGNEKKFSLFQVKNIKDVSKSITEDDLFSESNSDFSLITHFFLYQKLKQDKKFRDCYIKDSIICTNIDFDVKSLKGLKWLNGKLIFVEDIDDEDDIFKRLRQNVRNSDHVVKGEEQCTESRVIYKFSENIIPFLKNKLENHHLTMFARTLIDCILRNESIEPHPDNIFNKYHLALAEHIIDEDAGNFQEKFVKGEKLSPTTKAFRHKFENELKNKTGSKLTLGNLYELVKKKQIILNLGNKFRIDNEKDWPQITVSDDATEDFLNHLIFAVNQPNEEELGNILKNKIGRGFNQITREYLFNKIFQRILELQQGKMEKRFITYKEGKDLFDVGMKEMSCCPTFQYEEELYTVTFLRNIKWKESCDFENFISSGKAVWYLETDEPWLMSLVLYQELIKCNPNFKYIFIPANDLEENPEIFYNLEKIQLRIVISASEFCYRHIESILGRFNSIIRQSQLSDRYICITRCSWKRIEQKTDDLILSNFYYKNLTINFSSLTEESQKSLLENKIIRFQGDFKTSIKELLKINENQMKELFADSKLGVLEILIKEQYTDVWKSRPRFSDLESVHYKSDTIMKQQQLEIAVARVSKDIFVFEGTEEEVKLLFPNKLGEVYKFTNLTSAFSVETHRFIILDAGKGAEQFREMCHMIDDISSTAEPQKYAPIIHLFKKSETDWIWVQSYNRNSYISRHFHPIFVGHRIKNLLLQRISSSFIIISGITLKNLVDSLGISDAEEVKILKQNCAVCPRHVVAEAEYSRRDRFRRKNLYWFKASEDETNLVPLYLYKYNGDIKDIREIIYRDTEHRRLTERDLINLNQRVIVLAGEAGAGKSFTMAHLAETLKNQRPFSLVVNIELKRFKENNAQLRCRNVLDVINFLLQSEVNRGNKSFTRTVMEHLMELDGGIIILWDGFDELSSEEERDHFLQIFKIIQKRTKAIIWITTRPPYHYKLETELSVLSYTFAPCNEKLRISILIQFWDTALRFSYKSEEKPLRIVLETRAREIMDFFNGRLQNVKKFMCIPLITRMIADVCLERIGTAGTCNTNVFFFRGADDFLIGDLYHEFVDKKYSIYLREKLNIDCRLDKDSLSALKWLYTRAYGHLAVNVLYSEFKLPIRSFPQKRDFFSLETLSKIGLLEGQNEANFIHRSFVEYFAVDEISDMLKQTSPFCPSVVQLWEILLNKLMMFPESRKFFESKLARDDEIANLTTLSEHKDIVYSLISEQSRDVFSVLWYAALDGLKRTLKFLLKAAKDFDSLKKITSYLFEEDIFNENKPYLLLIVAVLEYGKYLDNSRVIEFILSNKYNLLHRAVLEDDLKAVDILISHVQDADEIIRVIVTASDRSPNYGKTALHVAFENCNTDIIEKCVEKLNSSQRSKIFHMRDFFNNLPFYNTSEKVKDIFSLCHEECTEITKLDSRFKESRRISALLREYVKSHYPCTSIELLGLWEHLPAFEERRKSVLGAIITRFFSQILFLLELSSAEEMMKYVQKIYEEAWNLKSLNPKPEIDIHLVGLFTQFLTELEDEYQIVPSRLSLHREQKGVDSLYQYIVDEIGDEDNFAILLVMANHVLTICRNNKKYIYFDPSMNTIFQLYQIRDTINILAKYIEFSDCKVDKTGFLIEHFDVDKANCILRHRGEGECDFYAVISAFRNPKNDPASDFIEIRKHSAALGGKLRDTKFQKVKWNIDI